MQLYGTCAVSEWMKCFEYHNYIGRESFVDIANAASFQCMHLVCVCVGIRTNALEIVAQNGSYIVDRH